MTRRPIYYPISALTRDHYGVLFPIGSIKLKSGETIQGTEVQGFRKTFRKGHPTERVVYRVRRPDGSTEDLPRYMEPTLFRPKDLERYPDPLPSPAALIGDVRWQSEHPPAEVPGGRDSLAWEAAYGAPGSISEKEAEVRILRGWKTERSKGVDDKGLGGPRGYQAGVAFGSRDEVRVLGWEPLRKDVSDWPVAMGWFTRLRNPDHKRVIELRSQDYSFRQIGEKTRKGLKPASATEWARLTYGKAITELTIIANRRRASL